MNEPNRCGFCNATIESGALCDDCKTKCIDCGKELTKEKIEYLESTCCECESKTDWYAED